MRILVVCSSWRVYGAEIATLNILEAFQQAGHELVAVVGPWSDGEFPRRLSSLGVATVTLPLGTFSAKPAWQSLWGTSSTILRLPVLWYKWLRLTRRFRPDVVILTNSQQATLLSPWLRRQPSYLVQHNTETRHRAKTIMYGYLAHRLHGFIAVSEFIGRYLQGIGVPDRKISVIYNGSSYDDVTKWPSCGSDNSQLRPSSIGIAGRISPGKGYESLLDAARILKHRQVSFAIRVFGSGDAGYLDQLKNKISQHGMSDYWTWMGYQHERRKMYQAMDICVVPSDQEESFGLVALEALASGVPVVASRIGGLPEIVRDGITGLLSEPRNPADLADKMEWLVRHPEEAVAMGVAGRRVVADQFSSVRMLAAFERLFKAASGTRPH